MSKKDLSTHSGFPEQRLIFHDQKDEHGIQKENVTEEPIPREQRLAICLYRLGRGGYLYIIAEMVGLAESKVCQIVVEVSKAIVEEL